MKCKAANSLSKHVVPDSWWWYDKKQDYLLRICPYLCRTFDIFGAKIDRTWGWKESTNCFPFCPSSFASWFFVCPLLAFSFPCCYSSCTCHILYITGLRSYAHERARKVILRFQLPWIVRLSYLFCCTSFSTHYSAPAKFMITAAAVTMA